MFLERIPHAVLFLRLPRLPGHGTLYAHPPHLEPLQTPQNRNRFDDYRSSVDDLLVLYPGDTRRKPVIEIGWAFCTINCVLLTTGTFLMFSCINQPKSPRLITEISKLSYGMYLMHIFWLGLWVTVFKHNLAFPTVAAIPCIAATTFICCFVTTKIISLIPGSKWIIG